MTQQQEPIKDPSLEREEGQDPPIPKDHQSFVQDWSASLMRSRFGTSWLVPTVTVPYTDLDPDLLFNYGSQSRF